MRGLLRRLRTLGQVNFLVMVLGTGPALAQDPRPPASADQVSAPANATPAGPRRLPVPMFRPVALPAYGKFPPPPGYIEKAQFNRGLVGVGTGVFLTSYGLGIAYAAATGFKQQSGWVALPVFGPFIAAAQRDLDCEGTPSTPAAVEACQRETMSEAGAVAILAGIGIGHVLGVSLLAAGFLDRRRIWLRDDLVSVNVQVGPGMGYFQVGGRF
jgi:hypothetical protein